MTTPLRIVYLWDADYPWDVRTEKVCAALASAGHEVHLAVRNRRWDPVLERAAEGTIHRMPPWRWLGRRLDGLLGFPAFVNPRWIGHLERTIRAVRPDLVIARDLPLCPTALWAAHRRGIPVLFDMAENYPALLEDIWATGRTGPFDWLVRNPSLARPVERYAVHRADRIMVVIEEAAGHLADLGVPRSRIDVVSNTPPRSRAEAPVPPRTVDLAYLGIMEVARGLDRLIDALGAARREGITLTTRMIGGGRDLALLEARARSQGLDGSTIEFTGYVPSHQDALSLMAGARVGVMPHLVNDWAQTTIPNKLFDYMAAGMAVLTSDARPCRRILEETGAGWVVSSGHPAGLVEALRSIASNPAQVTAAGEAGRRAILSRYHWEADTAVLLEAVRRTVSPPD